MSNGQLETVKLTARFKLDGEVDESLFKTYKAVVNELLDYAHSKGITSFERLKSEKYHEMRRKYPELPSHYIYTACQLARSIYKSFRKLKRRGKVKKNRPLLRKNVIMLDDHLFSLDLESWKVSISAPYGRRRFELLHGKYHKRFRDWKVGQAWLVRTPEGIFLNVVFSREIEVEEPKAFVGTDLNENNVTLSLPNGEFVKIVTHEKEIRTSYYLKRRRIQKKIRRGKRRRELLRKYGKREKNRVNDLHHKLANKIVEIAENYGGIALEDLSGIRDSINYSAEMNGRLHRWSFRKLLSIIEYKAKLRGVRVVFVDPAYTSTLCPRCGGRLSASPNGHRFLKCGCGLEADRDVVGSLNIALRARRCGELRSPRKPVDDFETGRFSHACIKSYKSGGEPERVEMEAFRAWLREHEEDFFANDTVGLGCFSYQPGEVVWAVTRRCNLNCMHCSISEAETTELSTEEGFSLIEDAAKLGAVKFAFTGGEPLVRRDIFELVEYAASYDMQVVMATNGTLIDEDVASRLKKAGLYRAAISIDGIGAAHDEFRGVKGAFDAMMRGVNACKKVGLRVQFLTTVSKINLKEIPKIMDLANRLQVDRIYLVALIAVGRGRQISDACLSADEMEQFFRLVLERQMKTNVWLKPICMPQFWAFLEAEGLCGAADRKFVGCTAGITRFHIFPNGDVAPCAYLPLKVGNVHSERFTKIIEKAELFQKFRNREIKGRCGSCEHRFSCGGCRSRAFAAFKDPLAEDPVCFLRS